MWFCAGLPAALSLRLWMHRKCLQEDIAMRRLGALYAEYKPTFFMWEAMLQAREPSQKKDPVPSQLPNCC